MSSAAPVLKTERSALLDVLRGLAILGILFNNIYGFSGYGFLQKASKMAFETFPIDKQLSFFQAALIEGKFYSLFSLLFGIGFSIILLRNKDKPGGGLLLFYRRLAGG